MQPDTSGTMRYLTAVLRPVEAVHPTIPALLEAEGVTPVAIEQTRLLDDGTEVTLLRVRGDLAAVDSILEAHPSVVEHAIAGERDGTVYSHSEPHDLARTLFELRDRYGVVVQTPLEFTGDGGLRGTILGDDETFQAAVSELPADLDVEVESIGDYHPEAERVFGSLTARQQEVLATAIRAGYYEDPRRASQRDLADALDVAPATVSQTLRRVEANVFSEYVLAELDDDAE